MGAAFGTIGQLVLYRTAITEKNGDAYDDVERYFKMAIDYANPMEKARNENYLIQARILRTIQLGAGSDVQQEFLHMAKIVGSRFETGHADDYDALFASQLIAMANVFFSREFALEVAKKTVINLENLPEHLSGRTAPYPAYLLTAYLFFFPDGLVSINTMQTLVTATRTFFKLDNPSHQPCNIMDILALKFIVPHAWSMRGDKTVANSYREHVLASTLYAPWAVRCGQFLSSCEDGTVSAKDALCLIASIPY